MVAATLRHICRLNYYEAMNVDADIIQNYRACARSRGSRDKGEEEDQSRVGRTNMLAPRKTLWSTPSCVLLESIELLAITRDDVCVDIGCGEGNWMAMCCASTEAKRVYGVEIDANRAAIAQASVAAYGERAHVYVGNALDAGCGVPLTDVTVVFVYLVPHGLRQIVGLFRDISHPVRIVSYMAPLPGIPVIKRVSPTMEHGPIYLHVMMPGCASQSKEGKQISDEVHQHAPGRGQID